MPDHPALTVAVVLASAGRPTPLADALRECGDQSDVSFVGLVSVPEEASLPCDRFVLDGWRVLVGVRVDAAPRNVGIDVLDGVGLVFFFDDDAAVVRRDYLTVAARFFTEHPEAVGLTGRVLLEGKLTAEIPRETALRALAASASTAPSSKWVATRELYGANFAFRSSVARDLRFDDRLPLYARFEDHDFAQRLMPFGALARVEDCVVGHRAAGSGGRTRHVRPGYSQLMNAAYLVGKGSFLLWLGAQQIGRPVVKNVALAIAGPARRSRRRRMRGKRARGTRRMPGAYLARADPGSRDGAGRFVSAATSTAARGGTRP